MSFEQHPVPQNISSYHFRLVGDMTIKQFFEVAAGAIVALLFYASPLPFIVRWPLIIISVIFGAALAFLPIQDRPLEQWLLAFFTSIYSPTRFNWQKSAEGHQYFKADNTAQAQSPQTQATDAIKDQVDAGENNPYAKTIEETEEKRLAEISGLLDVSTAEAPAPAGTPEANLIAAHTNQPQVVSAQAPQELKQDLSVPAQGSIEVKPQGFNEKSALKTQESTLAGTVSQIPGTLKPEAAKAQFTDQASPPLPPDKPNTIVGQVLGADGKIVEGAILEIKDAQNRPVRALKSNKAGHFIIVTPLLNGSYNILTEKDGFVFETASFEAKGEIIPPILIKASQLKN